MSEKYKIAPEKIDYILNTYGSVEIFIQAYIRGEAYSERIGILGENIRSNFIFDIAGRNTEEMTQMYQEIFVRNQELVIIDSEQLLEEIRKFDERKYNIFCFLFGIEDGQTHTLVETGRKFNVSGERIRGIEHEIIRKLRKPTLLRKFTLYNEEDIKEQELTEEEKSKLNELKERIYFSDFFFIPDEEFRDKPGSIEASELRKIGVELRNVGSDVIQRRNVDIKDIHVQELDFSSRTFNSLMRAGITTIGKLREKSISRLRLTRGFGEQSIIEIIDRMNGFFQQREEMTVNGESISDLNFSKIAYYELMRLGITIEQLKTWDPKTLISVNHLPSNCFRNIEEVQAKLPEIIKTIAKHENEKLIDEHAGIRKLGLSHRARACLAQKGIHTIEQLEAMSMSELRTIRNMGEKTLNEILSKLGIFLENDDRPENIPQLEPADIEAMPIDELPLSETAKKLLMQLSINTIAEFREIDLQDWRTIRQIDSSVLNEIISKLEEIFQGKDKNNGKNPENSFLIPKQDIDKECIEQGLTLEEVKTAGTKLIGVIKETDQPINSVTTDDQGNGGGR